jgi:hypothetical protein
MKVKTSFIDSTKLRHNGSFRLCLVPTEKDKFSTKNKYNYETEFEQNENEALEQNRC